MTTETHVGYVLHRRPWRESSLLIDLLSASGSRLGAVARGVSSRRGWQGCLQPFRPLRVELTGKSELRSLRAAEEHGPAVGLVGERLYCGFYLNELLVRLLARNDPHDGLFAIYEQALQALPSAPHAGVPLRYFELQLLQQLGYGLQLQYDADSGEPLRPEQRYEFGLETGPRAVRGERGYAGDSLLALAGQRLETLVQRREARLLLQQALKPHLGERPLHSRRLMRRSG
ncbi:MAG: DNA repair protein RecO [Wenzhouxiangellaceae bacterium]